MGGIPTLRLNYQQPYARNNHNEIWVSVGDYRLVVDNDVVREPLKELKDLFLARARVARKTIRYHFCHAHFLRSATSSASLCGVRSSRRLRHRFELAPFFPL